MGATRPLAGSGGPGLPIWTNTATQAARRVIAWIARQPYGNALARTVEIDQAARAAARNPGVRPVFARRAGQDLRARRAGKKLLVIDWWDQQKTGDVVIVYVTHTSRRIIAPGAATVRQALQGRAPPPSTPRPRRRS